ncbi:MAG: endonuclease [Planctomycetota bacterium]
MEFGVGEWVARNYPFIRDFLSGFAMICFKPISIFSVVFLLLFFCRSAAAQWEAPSSYYDNVSATGSLLKQQLTTAMSAGHIERRYGDYRFSAAIHDQDPNDPSNINLIYTETSVDSSWDSGATWNREHIWPVSRQPGSASNSTRGNLGDPHALRACNPSTNSSRGNKPFGFGDSTGSFGSLGTFWYPGDLSRGDVARSLFYSDTRWTSLGISLANGVPSGNQMGDLDSLLHWHFMDPPDEFERRRNHTIYSQAFNPTYYTNNRNAYIDHPEYVWSIYVDQQNDSMITIGESDSQIDGGTDLLIDFGSVISGNSTNLQQSVQLNKTGLDGTYYSVTTFDDAISEVTGRNNAFKMDGPDSRAFDITLDADYSTPGINVGFVVVDNLDVTTGGGQGRGANDGDDVISMSLAVLDHSNASFSESSDEDVLSMDLGQVELGKTIKPVLFGIYNLISPFGPALTARLNLFSTDVVPKNSGLAVQGKSFENLPAGSSSQFSVVGTPQQLGVQQAAVVIMLSDEDIPGAESQTLLVDLTYEVVESSFLLGDINRDGMINLLDVNPFVLAISGEIYIDEADINQDGVVNLVDVQPFVELLSN